MQDFSTPKGRRLTLIITLVILSSLFGNQSLYAQTVNNSFSGRAMFLHDRPFGSLVHFTLTKPFAWNSVSHTVRTLTAHLPDHLTPKAPIATFPVDFIPSDHLPKLAHLGNYSYVPVVLGVHSLSTFKKALPITSGTSQTLSRIIALVSDGPSFYEKFYCGVVADASTLAASMCGGSQISSGVLAHSDSDSIVIDGTVSREVSVVGSPLALPFVHELTTGFVKNFNTNIFKGEKIASYTKNIKISFPRLLPVDLHPLATYSSFAFGSHTVAAATSISPSSRRLPFIDQLSLSLYCALGKVSDLSRCSYENLLSGLFASNLPQVPAVAPQVIATSSPSQSRPSPIYLTTYITKYIAGPKGADGINGENGQDGTPGKDGKDSKDSQGGFGGYISPSNNYQAPTPYFSQSLIGASAIGYLRDATIEYSKFNYGTSTGMYLTNANINNSIFNGGSIFYNNVIFNDNVNVNNLTATSTNLVNATSTNHYVATLSATDSTFTNSTTTNSFISNLTAANAILSTSTTTNAVVTNSTTTNAYVSNLLVNTSTTTAASITSLSSANALILNSTTTNSFTSNATTTDGFFSRLRASLATITDLFVTNATTTNLVATNATTTNFSATNGSITNATSTNGFFSNMWATLATIVGLNVTNSTTTNATTTNSYITTLRNDTGSVTNLTSVNATTTNLTGTNSLFTNGSTTNFFTTNLAVGTAQTSGNQTINGSLTVAGTTTIGSNTVIQGSITLGTSTSNFITVNGLLNSNLVPAANISYDLGSPSFYYRNVYVDTITANTLSSANTTISGTTNSLFSINSDNASVDAEDSSLVFFRGAVTPNALLRWNATTKRLESNMSFHVQNETPISGTTTFTVEAGQGQGGVPLMKFLDNGGAVLSSFDSTGGLAIGTTTTNLFKLQVAGHIGPDANNLYNLGSNNNRFASIFGVNMFATSSFITNSTSTNAFINNAFLSNATSTLFAATTASTTNLTALNATITNASTTNLSATGATFGNTNTTGTANITGALTASSTLAVTGQSTLYGILNMLADILPTTDTSRSLGSNSLRFLNLFSQNIFATSSVITNATSTNLFATNSSSTNFFSVNASTTNLTVSNASYFGGNSGIWSGSGDVGIGTLSPSRQLHVSSGGTGIMRISGTSSGGEIEFQRGSVFSNIGNDSAIVGGISPDLALFGGIGAGLKFYTNGVSTPKMFLDIDGNLGIGTTTPGSLLSVQGNAYFGGNVTATGTLAVFGTSTFATTGGNVGIGTSAPGSKLDIVASSPLAHSYGYGFSLSSTKIADWQQEMARISLVQNVATSSNFVWDVAAQKVLLQHTGAGTSQTLDGARYQIGVGDNGTVVNATALLISSPWEWDSTGSAPFGSITNLYGLKVSASGPANTNVAVTNNYGLYIDSPTNIAGGGTVSVANNYALYAASAVQKSYFAGNVGVGVTTPTDKLQIAGNTTPSVDVAYSLGSSTLRFLNLFSQNIFATSSVITNATSTNLFATNGSITNATSTLFAATTASTTNLTALNATITNASTTNLSATGATFGNTNTTGTANITGALTASSTLAVTGQSTLYGILNMLADILPTTDTSRSLGSNSLRFLNLFSQNIFATSSVITNATSTNLFATTAAFTTLSSTGTSTFAVNGGRVGIGTTTPTNLLHVWSTGASNILSESTATSGTNAGFSAVGGTANASWFFGTNRGDLFGAGDSFGIYKNLGTAGAKLVINDAGNVGIGTTTPAALLHIQSATNAGTTASQFFVDANKHGGISLLAYDDLNNQISFGSRFNGTSFLATQSSSERISTPSNSPGSIAFSGATGLTVGNAITYTEIMRVGGDGNWNVGIGTTTQGSLLSIASSTATGSSGLLSVGTTSTIFNVLANGYTGLGVGAPTARLTVSDNTIGTIPTTPLAGTLAHFVGADSTNPRITLDAFTGTPVFDFRRANGTAAARTATLLDDALGQLSWFGQGSTTLSASSRANVRGSAAENWTDTAQGTYLSFFTTSKLNTASTERMRIDSTGNVGIGTTAPPALLSVLGSGTINTAGDTLAQDAVIMGPNVNFNAAGNAANLNIESNSTLGADVGGTLGLGGRYTGTQFAQFGIIKAAKENATDGNYSTYMAFGTRVSGLNITEKMRIDSSGNVGIGTTTPVGKLHVVGSGFFDQGTRVYTVTGQDPSGASSGNTYAGMFYSTANAALRVEALSGGVAWRNVLLAATGGSVGIGTSTPGQLLTVAGTIQQTASKNCAITTDAAGNLNCTSDERLKDLHGFYDGGLAQIQAINPIRFSYKKESYVHVGFSAQNVSGVLPEGAPMQDSGFYGLDTNAILALSVTSIKEIAKRINMTAAPMDTASIIIDNLGGIHANGFQTDTTVAVAEQFSAEEAVDIGTVVAFSASTYGWNDSFASTTNNYQMSGVRKAHSASEAIGIVTSRAGLISGTSASAGVPVVFSGRVLVQVTSEHGTITRGDRLTLSSTVGGKATKMQAEGQSLGVAISDDDGSGRVLMVLNSGYQKVDASSRVVSTSGMLTVGNIDLSANGVAITNIKALASANGTWSIDENGRIVAKILCLEDVCIDKTALANILNGAGQMSAGSPSSSSESGNPPAATSTDTGTATTTPSADGNEGSATSTSPEPAPVDPLVEGNISLLPPSEGEIISQ